MERGKFTNQLGELVELHTLSGNISENSKALDLVEMWTEASVVKKRVKNGNAEILLLGTGNLLSPDLGYLVHMDVVDAENTELFEMTQRNGKLYGRGVSDMKYSIPIGVELLNTMTRNNNRAKFTLAITTDEEVGGSEGGNYLANKMKFRPKVLIVPDGGDGFVFVNKSKGVAHIWIESKGISAHASKPWLGRNALRPLIKLADTLAEKYDVNSTEPNWETTMNLGVLQGGVSTNQVCDQAVLKLDFRFPESRTVQEIFKEVKVLGSKVDSTMRLKLAASGDPTFSSTKHPEVARFLKIAKEVVGKPIKITGEEGASDARYWAKYNIPIIMMKPDGGGIHSDKEWIDIDSCLKFYRILEKYVTT